MCGVEYEGCRGCDAVVGKSLGRKCGEHVDKYEEWDEAGVSDSSDSCESYS